MPEQNQSISAKAPAILDLDNIPVAALSANQKATLNLLRWVDFDRPLEGSSVNPLRKKPYFPGPGIS